MTRQISKSVKVSTLNAGLNAKAIAQWAAASAELNTVGVDKVPSGWFTLAQVCELMSLRESQGRRRVEMLVKLGKVDTRVFRLFHKAHLYPTLHYKVKSIV